MPAIRGHRHHRSTRDAYCESCEINGQDRCGVHRHAASQRQPTSQARQSAYQHHQPLHEQHRRAAPYQRASQLRHTVDQHPLSVHQAHQASSDSQPPKSCSHRTRILDILSRWVASPAFDAESRRADQDPCMICKCSRHCWATCWGNPDSARYKGWEWLSQRNWWKRIVHSVEGVPKHGLNEITMPNPRTDINPFQVSVGQTPLPSQSLPAAGFHMQQAPHQAGHSMGFGQPSVGQLPVQIAYHNPAVARPQWPNTQQNLLQQSFQHGQPQGMITPRPQSENMSHQYAKNITHMQGETEDAIMEHAPQQPMTARVDLTEHAACQGDMMAHMKGLVHQYCAVCLAPCPAPYHDKTKGQESYVQYHRQEHCILYSTGGVPMSLEGQFEGECSPYFNGRLPWCNFAKVAGHVQDRERTVAMAGAVGEGCVMDSNGQIIAIQNAFGIQGILDEKQELWATGKGGFSAVIRCDCRGERRHVSKSWESWEDIVKFLMGVRATLIQDIDTPTPDVPAIEMT